MKKNRKFTNGLETFATSARNQTADVSQRLPMFLLTFLLTFFFSGEPASMVRWTTGIEHDFGTMPQGRPRAFTFRFENTSTETLTVETVRTTCGCTAARYTETPIDPGAEGEVTLEYDAYKQGAFTKKVKVFFDKQKKAEVLTITGEVE